MVIVLEELYGMRSIPFMSTEVKIKPTLLRGGLPLREYIQQTKRSLLPSALPLQSYSLSEELVFFKGIAEQAEISLYFYDPAYTSIQNLYRVRNLLLPDHKLIPIPFDAMKSNKAELLYLMDALADWAGKQDAPLTYEKFLLHTQYFKSRCTPWSLVAEVGPFTHVKRHRRLHKPPAKPLFKQVYTHTDGKLKVHKTGDLLELWQQILAAKTEEKQAWVVRKGITTDLPGSDIIVDLDNQTLPVHIPYVQAIFAPIHISNLLDARVPT